MPRCCRRWLLLLWSQHELNHSGIFFAAAAILGHSGVYLSEIVMLFGLARRTVRQTEKVSPFYTLSSPAKMEALWM